MHGLFRFGAFALVLLLAAGCASAPAGDGGARPGERLRTATSIAAPRRASPPTRLLNVTAFFIIQLTVRFMVRSA